MREAQIRDIIGRVFGVAPESVTDAFGHRNVAWDSLKHINLVIALEQEFGVRFTPDEVLGMINYPAIRAAVAAKTGVQSS